MAADIAMELREYNIASISLNINSTQTELFMDCGLTNGDNTVNEEQNWNKI